MHMVSCSCGRLECKKLWGLNDEEFYCKFLNYVRMPLDNEETSKMKEFVDNNQKSYICHIYVSNVSGDKKILEYYCRRCKCITNCKETMEKHIIYKGRKKTYNQFGKINKTEDEIHTEKLMKYIKPESEPKL